MTPKKIDAVSDCKPPKKIRMGKRQRFLLEQLAEGEKNIRELSLAYGERDPNLIIQSLNKLIKRGLVERIRTGCYRQATRKE